jgi:osmoprotectant transport system ATP-binding protein
VDQAPLLQLNAIAKRHDGVAALDAVDLAVPAGTLLALVGPSGSGKTTLLKTINRLVEPDEGNVVLAGEDVRAIPPAALRRRIGYVFQGIGLFPHLSVAENIAIVPRLTGAASAERDRRALELLDLVALPRGFASRYPAALSGGQSQRVGVARALAARPSLMLMDEPFGALDPLTRDALGDDFRALHKELGLTTIMITHDMTEAVLLAERVAVMRGGKLLAEGTPAELASSDDPYVGELLGTPRRQAKRLAGLLPKDGAA